MFGKLNFTVGAFTKIGFFALYKIQILFSHGR